MKIISFAETTPALLAHRKSVTRRDWKDSYARSFKAGEHIQAYDRSPRIGGKRIAIIELTAAPEKGVPLGADDWEAEGFAYMTEHGLTLFGKLTPAQVWDFWHEHGEWRKLWLVRFRLVEVT